MTTKPLDVFEHQAALLMGLFTNLDDSVIQIGKYQIWRTLSAKFQNIDNQDITYFRENEMTEGDTHLLVLFFVLKKMRRLCIMQREIYHKLFLLANI